MYQRWLASFVIFVAAAISVAGCASSGASTYSAQTPEAIAAKVEIVEENDTAAINAPVISSRASFGEFSKGMLTGGSDFGNAVSLHGQRDANGVLTHWLRAELQYTNIGGVYRDYDRAGIEGIAALTVTPISNDRHYSLNSVNMTEVIRIDLAETDLRASMNSGFTLRLADDSNHIAELTVPASYVAGYLQRVDALLGQLPK